jgi:hypothetical protein
LQSTTNPTDLWFVVVSFQQLSKKVEEDLEMVEAETVAADLPSMHSRRLTNWKTQQSFQMTAVGCPPTHVAPLESRRSTNPAA